MDASKESLITRLLNEGKITRDEAALLRKKEEKEIQYIPSPTPSYPMIPMPAIKPFKQKSWIDEEMEKRAGIAERCGCNPANGGSGICGCTLTGPIVTC